MCRENISSIVKPQEATDRSDELVKPQNSGFKKTMLLFPEGIKSDEIGCLYVAALACNGIIV